jgi:uncharacterized protein YukE
LIVLVVVAFFSYLFYQNKTRPPDTQNPMQPIDYSSKLATIEKILVQIQGWSHIAPETLDRIQTLSTDLKTATRKMATVDHLITLNKNISTVNQSMRHTNNQVDRMFAVVDGLPSEDALMKLDESINQLQTIPPEQLTESLQNIDHHSILTQQGLAELRVKMNEVRELHKKSRIDLNTTQSLLHSMQVQIDALMVRVGARVIPQMTRFKSFDSDPESVD